MTWIGAWDWIISLKVWTLLLSRKNMPNVRRKPRNQLVKLSSSGRWGMKFFQQVALLLNNHALVWLAAAGSSYMGRKTMPITAEYSSKLGKKCFIRLMFTDILGTMRKQSKIPATGWTTRQGLVKQGYVWWIFTLKGCSLYQWSDMYDTLTWTHGLSSLGRWEQ